MGAMRAHVCVNNQMEEALFTPHLPARSKTPVTVVRSVRENAGMLVAWLLQCLTCLVSSRLGCLFSG